MTLLGAVLAGGISSRFGSDKADVLVGDEPLWRRQLRVLAEAGADRVVLVRRAGQPAPPGAECWLDGSIGDGPIRGLRAALEPRAASWVAVLAVDMPGITAGWFRWLREYCREGRGALACHPEAAEPLAAIYPREALAEVDLQLRAGDFSVQRLARTLVRTGKMALVRLSPDQVNQTASINTPQDLESGRRNEVW